VGFFITSVRAIDAMTRAVAASSATIRARAFDPA
jgi:hypothetical protein